MANDMTSPSNTFQKTVPVPAAQRLAKENGKALTKYNTEN